MSSRKPPRDFSESLSYLSKGLGIWDAKPREKIGRLLCQRWHIRDDHDDADIRAIAEGQLELLLRRLINDKKRNAVRVGFNIGGLAPTTMLLGERQRYHGHFESTRGVMAEAIKAFAGDLAKITPRPLSPDEIEAIRRKQYEFTTKNLSPQSEMTLNVTVMGHEPHPDASGTPTPFDDYIHRADVENQIKETFRTGKRLILIWGDAGTGKSRLAREVATLHARIPEDIAIVDAQSSRTLNDGVALALQQHQIPTGEHEAVLRQKFKTKLLKGDQAFKAVVIDNLDDASLIQQLVPDEPDSLVLITSRTNLLANERGGETVWIGNLNDDEARAMVVSRLPEGVTSDQVTRLTDILGGRPLAIEHACAYLRESQSSIDTFCEVLQQNLAETLELAVDGEVTLTAIYRLMLDQLDDAARDLLDIIVTLPQASYMTTVISLMTRHFLCRGYAADVVDVSSSDLFRAQRLVARLERRSLITTVMDDIPHSEAAHDTWHTQVEMHQLTRHIIHELRRSFIEATYNNILGIFEDAAPAVDWSVLAVLQKHTVDYVLDLTLLLPEITGRARRREIYPDIACFTALALKAFAQNFTEDLTLIQTVVEVYERCEVASARLGESASHDPLQERRALHMQMLGFQILRYCLLVSPRAGQSRELVSTVNRITEARPALFYFAICSIPNEWYPSNLDRSAYEQIIRDFQKQAILAHAAGSYRDAAHLYMCVGELLFHLECDFEARDAYEQAVRLLTELWRRGDDAALEELMPASLRIMDICLSIGEHDLAHDWWDGHRARFWQQDGDQLRIATLTDLVATDHLRISLIDLKRQCRARSGDTRIFDEAFEVTIDGTHVSTVEVPNGDDTRKTWLEQLSADIEDTPDYAMKPRLEYSLLCLVGMRDVTQARRGLAKLKQQMRDWKWTRAMALCDLAESNLFTAAGDCPEEMQLPHFATCERIAVWFMNQGLVRSGARALLARAAFAIRYGFNESLIEQCTLDAHNWLTTIGRTDLAEFIARFRNHEEVDLAVLLA